MRLSPVTDALLRALGYMLLPRVIGMTLLPLLLMTLLALGLGYWLWEPAVAAMRAALGQWSLLGWLDGRLNLGPPGALAGLLAPLGVIALATLVIVLVTLGVVSVTMTPALTQLVAARRFPALERRHGASLWASLIWSGGSLVLAMLALLLSVPLWLVPPLVLILPPLIWGWLTYRVMSFDALAEHATPAERAAVLRQHRAPLLLMGIMSGFMGAAPSVVWASGLLFAAFFVVLVPLAIWIYTLVFVFSSLWFAHYTLQALQQLRGSAAPATAAPVANLRHDAGAPVGRAEPSKELDHDA